MLRDVDRVVETDAEFKSSGLLYKMLFILVSTSLVRPRYYIAWKLSKYNASRLSVCLSVCLSVHCHIDGFSCVVDKCRLNEFHCSSRC